MTATVFRLEYDLPVEVEHVVALDKPDRRVPVAGIVDVALTGIVHVIDGQPSGNDIQKADCRIRRLQAYGQIHIECVCITLRTSRDKEGCQ